MQRGPSQKFSLLDRNIDWFEISNFLNIKGARWYCGEALGWKLGDLDIFATMCDLVPIPFSLSRPPSPSIIIKFSVAVF